MFIYLSLFQYIYLFFSYILQVWRLLWMRYWGLSVCC